MLEFLTLQKFFDKLDQLLIFYRDFFFTPRTTKLKKKWNCQHHRTIFTGKFRFFF